MKLLIFIPPRDFRDESLKMLRLFFDKWGVQYSITSYSNKDCVGAHGAVVAPDLNASKVPITDYDGIVLVDGSGIDEYKLYEYRPLLDMLLLFNSRSKTVGAISNAIKVVARANIVRGRKVSTPKDGETPRFVQLFHGEPSEKRIEISSNLITIADPASLESTLQEMLKHLGVM